MDIRQFFKRKNDSEGGSEQHEDNNEVHSKSIKKKIRTDGVLVDSSEPEGVGSVAVRCEAGSSSTSSHSVDLQTEVAEMSYTHAYDIMDPVPGSEWKVHVLKTPWKPPASFSWPSSTHNKKGREETRKITGSHLEQFKWLAYSAKKGGYYCKYCVLMHPESSTVGESKGMQKPGKLVSAPLTTFNKLTGKDGALSSHELTTYHQSSLRGGQDLCYVSSHPSEDIRNQLSSHRNEQILKNRAALKSLIRIIIHCGRQTNALRGHRETVKESCASNNDGNFLSLVRLLVESGDEQLKDHLDNAPHNARYTSPKIQNEIISIIGELIQERVIKTIHDEGGIYAVLADETQDIATVEQLSLCLRYVSDGKIHEDFICFLDLFVENFDIDFSSLEEGEVIEPKMTGKKIGGTIVSALGQLGLDIMCCVGQGYDGAASMSSCNIGAASVILEQNPCAVYSHCVAHALNLAVVNSSTTQEIRNMMGTVREIVAFINVSSKRLAVFKAAVAHCFPGARVNKLKGLCDTRWIERHECIETFIELLEAIKLCLKQISQWRSDPKASVASCLCLKLDDPTFIVALLSTSVISARLRPVAAKLQLIDQDVVGAMETINSTKTSLQSTRENVDNVFKEIYSKCEALCKSERGMYTKRICSAQKHRPNVPADSPESFFKRTIFLPLIDGVISQMNSRFSKHNKKALSLGAILPEQAKIENSANFDEIFRFYENLLPQSSLERARGEFDVWCAMWSERDRESMPVDAIGALNACDVNAFPAVHRLLKILAIQPVSTASAERSFSCLRRLKDWLRSTMSEQRLSGLALMALNRNRISLADAEEVLNRFAARKARKLNILV